MIVYLLPGGRDNRDTFGNRREIPRNLPGLRPGQTGTTVPVPGLEASASGRRGRPSNKTQAEAIRDRLRKQGFHPTVAWLFDQLPLDTGRKDCEDAVATALTSAGYELKRNHLLTLKRMARDRKALVG